MALNDAFRHLPDPTYRERVLAVFTSPGLYDLRTVLPACVPGMRRDSFPPLLQYGVAVAARIYGNQEVALRELAEYWPQVTAAYTEWLGDEAPTSLPPMPPTARQQDRFVSKVITTKGVLRNLSHRYTHIAIGQARFQGNFPDGVTPDFAKPDIRHAIMGDGTYVKPFSEVVETVDEATGEFIVLGSRATIGRPRIQPQRTDPRPDKKKAVGINHVIVSTWTCAGWVILAHEQAFGSEVIEARVAIERIQAVLKSRLHYVVWDMVLQGRDVQKLMADARVMVVSKQPARKTTRATRDGYQTPGITDAEARRLFADEQPLPLGTSVYPRNSDKPADVISSEFHRYRTLDEEGCRHDLWVDDGALFAVVPDGAGRLLKATRAVSTTAVPVPDTAHQREFTVPTTWRLPCSDAPNGQHAFETVLTPADGRGGRPSRGPGKALHDLRPIARADMERFGDIHGTRNITESYNAWFKNLLGKNKRAMRLAPRAQLLDSLCAGTYANALSYWRFLQLPQATAGDAAA